MTDFALDGMSAEASGHPTECTEPASGSVNGGASSVTVTDSGGNTKALATVADSSVDFPSHSHDYSESEGCHDMQSHSIDPDTVSSSVSVNGSAVYIVGDVGTDPTTGGTVSISGNTTVGES